MNYRLWLSFMLCLAVLLGTFYPAAKLTARSRDDWTEKTLAELSLRDRIAQLVQIRVPGRFINRQSEQYKKIEALIRDEHVGGLVLFAGNVYEAALLLNDFQAISRLPLLVSSDFERGAAFRIDDTTSFPWTMALGATGDENLAYQQGFITAAEARALGVHWVFAPVVDVNNNPDNPVINIRALGENPEDVARLGAALIRGIHAGGALATAKHFPGHGDTATDSHVGLPVVTSDRHHMEMVELVPFRRAIATGVDAIMTAHVAVPQLTENTKTPATLSPLLLTDVLKNQMGFSGIVVTDALEMAGITKRYDSGAAAIAAIQAGADVLLLPLDATKAIDKVEEAIRSGVITEERIDESVRKILDAKKRLSLHENPLTNIDAIGNIVSSPDKIDLAATIAERAVTLLRDKRRQIPLKTTTNEKIYGLVLTPALEDTSGSAFLKSFRKHFPAAATEWVNARVPAEQIAAIDKGIAAADIIVLATLTRLTTGQNQELPATHRAIMRKLAASPKPVIWICLGSPYLLRLAPEIGSMICTFSYSDNSQIAAVKALAGEIAITGKTPVTIPDIAPYGAGLPRPANPRAQP